jgi:DNA topoisomerase-3
MILQRTIERAQMEKLLATGRTDLLQFVSQRTRRPFQAYLVRQPTEDRLRVREARAEAPRPGRDDTAPRAAKNARPGSARGK